MLKHQIAWLKRPSTLTLMLLVSGCATVQSGEAICNGTSALRDTHAEALLADGGPRSIVSGDNLIARLDAGCGG